MTPASMPIPSFDPIPMPAPEPLVHGLLVVTFLLHALFMNLVLGSTPIMVVTEWLGQRKGSDRFQRLARTLSSIIPTAMALAIVLGVAPLLFIQVLYGQLFYTAAILVGRVWILLILVLILAYYGLYLYKYRQPWLLDKPGWQLAIGVTCSGLFLFAALVFVTVSVLMLSPERWREIQGGGFLTAVTLPSVLPRYLHMVLAALAGSGLMLVLYGVVVSSRWAAWAGGGSGQDPAYPQWVIRYGVAWTLGGTLPQILVGPWLLLSLPDEVRQALVLGGGRASFAFFASLTFALLGVVLLNASLFAPQVRGLSLGGVASLMVTIALMAMVRDRVRYYWVREHFDPTALPADPQWGFIALFGTLLVAGAAVVLYLIAAFIRARPAPT